MLATSGLVLILAPVVAQEPAQIPTLKATVSLVNLFATVRDKNKRIVGDLQEEDFKIQSSTKNVTQVDSDRAHATGSQHRFVKRHGLVRDERDEATLVMLPFRRSPARPSAVQLHHRPSVLPLGSPSRAYSFHNPHAFNARAGWQFRLIAIAPAHHVQIGCVDRAQQHSD
jgi:hypothetical protein